MPRFIELFILTWASVYLGFAQVIMLFCGTRRWDIHLYWLTFGRYQPHKWVSDHLNCYDQNLNIRFIQETLKIHKYGELNRKKRYFEIKYFLKSPQKNFTTTIKIDTIGEIVNTGEDRNEHHYHYHQVPKIEVKKNRLRSF